MSKRKPVPAHRFSLTPQEFQMLCRAYSAERFAVERGSTPALRILLDSGLVEEHPDGVGYRITDEGKLEVETHDVV